MSKELRSEAEIMQKRLYIFITSSHESVHKLYYIADELDMNFKKISIAKIAGSSVSIVGGILAVIGFGLSFVTFGASLGLSIAGGVVAGVGGTTVGGSRIADILLSKPTKRSAQVVLDKYYESLEQMVFHCTQIDDLLKTKDNNMEKLENWNAFWKKLIFGVSSVSMSFGWTLTANTVMTGIRLGTTFVDDVASPGAKIGATAFRTLGSTGKGFHIFGGVFGMAFLPFDIYTLVDSAIVIHKKKPHEISNKIRENAYNILTSCPTEAEIHIMIAKTFM